MHCEIYPTISHVERIIRRDHCYFRYKRRRNFCDSYRYGIVRMCYVILSALSYAYCGWQQRLTEIGLNLTFLLAMTRKSYTALSREHLGYISDVLRECSLFLLRITINLNTVYPWEGYLFRGELNDGHLPETCRDEQIDVEHRSSCADSAISENERPR